jgi:phosphatidylglycerophosphate synthase
VAVIHGIVRVRTAASWWHVGGVPMIVRHIRALQMAGVTTVTVVGPVPEQIKLKKLCPKSEVDSAPTMPETAGDVLWLDGDYLIDPRIVKKLVESPAGTLVSHEKTICAGHLNAAQLKSFLGKGELAGLTYLQLNSIRTHSAEQRANVPLLLEQITDLGEARQATWAIIKSTQKALGDLPSEYIDPPFENAITYWLCRTSITPNMVTVFNIALGFAIAGVFFYGYLLPGILMTYLVEWLDGVDGKLARTKLQFSKMGDLDATFDYFYENAWYLGITYTLAQGYWGSTAWWVGGALVVLDTLWNILFAIGWKKLKRDILEGNTFDRYFRRIGGRRNIYCFMFLIGFFTPFPFETLCLVAAWALLTDFVLVVRLAAQIKQLRVI